MFNYFNLMELDRYVYYGSLLVSFNYYLLISKISKMVASGNLSSAVSMMSPLLHPPFASFLVL